MSRYLDINHLIWPKFNETDQPYVMKWSNGKEKIVLPGERVIYPKQVEALRALRQYETVFYGGAVGGGKSWILRWAIIRQLLEWGKPKNLGGLGMKGVVAGIFADSYVSLKELQIDDFMKMPEELGIWYSAAKEFHLHDYLGGGIVKLRNLDDPGKWAGAQFAMMGFDELTRISKPTFDFVTATRKRWAGIDFCPTICVGNPGSVGHQWVYKAFVNPATRLGAYHDADLNYDHRGNFFIQALPYDNPLLGKQYWAGLKRMDEKSKKALLEGDWSVFAGQYFDMLDHNIHFIPETEPADNWTLFRAIDWGNGAHPSVCVWLALHPNGEEIHIYRELSEVTVYLEQFKKKVMEMSGREVYRDTVGDPSMWTPGTLSEGRSPADVFNNRRDGIGSLNMRQAANSREQGWAVLRDLLSWEGNYIFADDGYPVYTFSRRPKLFIHRTCPNVWSSMANVIHDENKVQDVKKTKGYYDPGQGDDEADAVRYGILSIRPGSTSNYAPRALSTTLDNSPARNSLRQHVNIYNRF